MVTHRCPCCGGFGDKPILFNMAKQKVFAYIWDNPNCITDEIHRDLGMNCSINHVSNTIRYIESILARTTNYRLIRTKTRTGPAHRGAAFHRYKIIEKPPVGVTGAAEGPSHGTV